MKRKTMYNLIIKETDDIEIQETTCRSPGNCNCYLDVENMCGYDRHILQQRVVEHYLRRVYAVMDMNNEQFMQTYGYYFDKGE